MAFGRGSQFTVKRTRSGLPGSHFWFVFQDQTIGSLFFDSRLSGMFSTCFPTLPSEDELRRDSQWRDGRGVNLSTMLLIYIQPRGSAGCKIRRTQRGGGWIYVKNGHFRNSVESFQPSEGENKGVKEECVVVPFILAIAYYSSTPGQGENKRGEGRACGVKTSQYPAPSSGLRTKPECTHSLANSLAHCWVTRICPYNSRQHVGGPFPGRWNSDRMLLQKNNGFSRSVAFFSSKAYFHFYVVDQMAWLSASRT